jgi:MarR family transcriptional regulator, 2-MHQ and catechol-resistance regulon repressor
LLRQVLSTQDSAVVAFARLLRGHAALRRQLNGSLAEHGLTVTDYEVLVELAREPDGVRRVDLAERVQLTASGITRLLDGLEGCGLVTRAECKTDRRVTYAVITGEGREKVEAAARTHLERIRALFSERYSDEEIERFAELLGRLPEAAVGAEDCEP